MRVLFTATPGWGHIHPMVPLARALLERGHDVLWATGADACERLGGDGFRAVAAGLGEREAMAELHRRFPEISSLAPPERPEFMFPRLFGTVRAATMLRDLAPAVEHWSPQLVVCDAAEFAGHLQARVLGVPSVTHSFGPLLPETRVATLSRLIEPLWSEQGLEPRPYGGAYDRLYVDIYPSSLQVGNRSHVFATQLLGARAFAIAGNEPLPEWVASESAPLVYITFGTVFSNVEALSRIVEGVRSLPVRMIVTVGPHGDPAILGAQPSNVHVARYIPQTELLERCAIVISHGGSGTFLGALAARVPQLCVPQAADQFLNAAACERAGAGLVLQPGAVSVASVRSAVERLLSDGAFRAAATRISAEIASMPSPGDVADRLASDFG